MSFITVSKPGRNSFMLPSLVSFPSGKIQDEIEEALDIRIDYERYLVIVKGEELRGEIRQADAAVDAGGPFTKEFIPVFSGKVDQQQAL